MRYFPAFFDLEGQPALIVGGGEVALRKLCLLERAGAAITVVAREAAPEIAARAARGAIALLGREFAAADLAGMRLAIVATSHRSQNRWIARLCDARGIPVNVVDDRAASRFIVPAIVDRDPVLVAVSTGGESPVLARRLRERLETLIPHSVGEFALWLGELRRAARRLADVAARRGFFEAIVDGEAARRFIDGDRRGAAAAAERLLSRSAAFGRRAGEVILVGAGPGDPELLTLKALRALQDADVILHDRLVADDVLDLARRDAVKICVGKACGGASTPQESINAALIAHARQGKRVVRLKGGDPFVFGRGGEELEALAAAGVRFRVIPGITAALGAAAYAGIPLTHRDHAHGVSFVTAHDGGAEPDWRALAMPGQTAVFYMGLACIERTTAKLIAHGAPPDRPAAVIAQGTSAAQKVVVATLATMHGKILRAGPVSPALLLVGDVVALQSKLGWLHNDGIAEFSASV